MRTLEAQVERWPIAGAFTIARGSKTEAVVVTVEIGEDGEAGRGEGAPYIHYGETADSVLAEIEAARGFIETGGDRAAMQTFMRPGAARNALDCACGPAAKREGKSAWALAGLARLDPLKTAYTLSLADPAAMAEQARANAGRPALEAEDRRAGRPRPGAGRARGGAQCRLIVDANEGLTLDALKRLSPEFARSVFMLIEQPLRPARTRRWRATPAPCPCAPTRACTPALSWPCARAAIR